MGNSFNNKYSIVVLATIVLLHSSVSYSQNDTAEEYLNYYQSGNYTKTLEIINKKLDEFYLKRVDDKRIPTGFISLKEASKEADLKLLFRKRKADHFFIEDNQEISKLHLFAARCYFKTNNLDYSLNHYIQALRFKKIELKKDDIIYYEMSQVFKKGSFFNAYINALETASTLNPDNYSYSLELGTALYKTTMKKKSIYHIERYVSSTNEAVSPELFLMLGNLNEDIANYLETEKNYIKYLEKNPDDGYIQFALGHIAFQRTGNFPLAIKSLERALKLLPDKEIFRKSKIYEYMADISLKDLEYKNAVEFYIETIKYQDKIQIEMNNKQGEINNITLKIRNIKSSLLREENFEQFDEYENLLDTKGKKELELRQIQNDYNKLNAGKVRWNIAFALERMEKLNDAINYYRDSIAFNYNANDARKKIINLELKIKRGY